jgi:hypothetical protein
VLWPPDGLNLKQGTCGELFGCGYLPLPLTQAKATTAGTNISTGDQSWTLFLNTKNFKGPVAFFTPYFWSRGAVDQPRLSGLLLDSRPSNPNRALQMETQYVPSVQATDTVGRVYARIAPMSFPRSANDESIVVHRIMSYKKAALWDSVQRWFDGGEPASGVIAAEQAVVHKFPGGGGATWEIYLPSTPKGQKPSVAWKSFATPTAVDDHTFGYRWNFDHVRKTESKDGTLATLPEFFRLETNANKKAQWVPVRTADVPPETGLTAFQFKRPREKPLPPYVTPEEPGSSWKKPGPVAGPFQAQLGDGSVVTYYWYRFADQPTLLNADLTDSEREAMQARVEKIHRSWKRDRDYLPSPALGKLAELDPALIVTPPQGFEAGYVPIVTRQGSND